MSHLKVYTEYARLVFLAGNCWEADLNGAVHGTPLASLDTEQA